MWVQSLTWHSRKHPRSSLVHVLEHLHASTSFCTAHSLLREQCTWSESMRQIKLDILSVLMCAFACFKGIIPYKHSTYFDVQMLSDILLLQVSWQKNKSFLHAGHRSQHQHSSIRTDITLLPLEMHFWSCGSFGNTEFAAVSVYFIPMTCTEVTA